MVSNIGVQLDIAEERLRQDKKWGEQNHDMIVWSVILGEEVGEVNKAVLEHRFGNKPAKGIYEELIQVAAVAIAAAECYLRNMENYKD